MRRHLSRPGAAAVELAVILPFLLLLLVGALEVGRMVETSQVLHAAAREAARQASLGNQDYAAVQATVVANLNAAGITNQAGLVVAVRNVTQNDGGGVTPAAYNPANAAQLDVLEVRVELPYSSVTLSPMASLLGNGRVSTQARWRAMKDSPLTVDSTIPP